MNSVVTFVMTALSLLSGVIFSLLNFLVLNLLKRYVVIGSYAMPLREFLIGYLILYLGFGFIPCGVKGERRTGARRRQP